VGLSQVNRYNLSRYGLASYLEAFSTCANVQAGARILAECQTRSGGDWGKAFSCYYSGNFVAGYRDGYVEKIYASMRAGAAGRAIALASSRPTTSPNRLLPLPEVGGGLLGSKNLQNTLSPSDMVDVDDAPADSPRVGGFAQRQRHDPMQEPVASLGAAGALEERVLTSARNQVATLQKTEERSAKDGRSTSGLPELNGRSTGRNPLEKDAPPSPPPAADTAFVF
jgi:hypothetical protein